MTSTLDSFPPPTTDPVGPPRPEPVESVRPDPDGAPPPTDPPATATPTSRPRRRRGVGHVLAIVAGALALVPGLGLLAGGTALAIAEAATDDGYFRYTPDRIESTGVAVITDDAWLDDPDDGGPWVLDWLDLDLRVRVDGAPGSDETFVGIARSADVEDYLAGARHSVVTDLDGHTPRYHQESGLDRVTAPDLEDIWVASAVGEGEQELTWDARGGRWSIVVMNADGSDDVAADVEVGVRSDAVRPVAITMIVVGGIVVLLGTALIVVGVRGRRAA